MSTPRSSSRLLVLALVALPLLVAPSCQLLRARIAVPNLGGPVYVAAPAGDPRLFVVERYGVIRIAENGVLRPTYFLDIIDQVQTTGESGLLSVAFPPDYAQTGHFYVFYVNKSGQTVVSRFVTSATDPNVADAESEHPLLVLTPPGALHRGGTLGFSPLDGYLYVGIGDGTNSANARDPNTLFGKMLRLDVAGGPTSDYAIPPDNPFAGDDGVRDEIWDLGLRNPFRWSFDRATGDLWIADVGQDAVEEIDFEPAGTGGFDYGWPTHEGSTCWQPNAQHPCDDPDAPQRYAFPVYEYTHADGCSIVGGVVSRGTAAFLGGSYLFTDYCTGKIWALVGGRRVELTTHLTASSLVGVVGISEDGFGEVYLSQVPGGRVWRLE